MKTLRALLAAVALAVLPLCALADLPLPTGVTATTAVTSATTTVVLAPAATPYYVYFLGALTSGTNSGATVNFEYSTSATCLSGNTLFSPAALAISTSAGSLTSILSGAAQAASASGPVLSATPFFVPAGDAICMITAGTTVAAYGIAVYGI